MSDIVGIAKVRYIFEALNPRYTLDDDIEVKALKLGLEDIKAGRVRSLANIDAEIKKRREAPSLDPPHGGTP